jgi:hypothetical protein
MYPMSALVSKWRSPMPLIPTVTRASLFLRERALGAADSSGFSTVQVPAGPVGVSSVKS